MNVVKKGTFGVTPPVLEPHPISWLYPGRWSVGSGRSKAGEGKRDSRISVSLPQSRITDTPDEDTEERGAGVGALLPLLGGTVEDTPFSGFDRRIVTRWAFAQQSCFDRQNPIFLLIRSSPLTASHLHCTLVLLDPRDPLLHSERTQGVDPDYWKGEVFAYVGLKTLALHFLTINEF